MSKDEMTYSKGLATKNNMSRHCIILMGVFFSFSCTFVLMRQIAYHHEMKKYRMSIEKATDFYHDYAWDKNPGVALSDAWGRPFSIVIDKKMKHIAFTSQGCDSNSREDDLRIDISAVSYHHGFRFKNHLFYESEFYGEGNDQ